MNKDHIDDDIWGAGGKLSQKEFDSLPVLEIGVRPDFTAPIGTSWKCYLPFCNEWLQVERRGEGVRVRFITIQE